MEEKRWSISPESPNPRAIAILAKLQTLGFCAHVDSSSDGHDNSDFYRILEVFMKEVDRREKIVPFPALLRGAALLRGGQAVDLLRLYQAVEESGFSSMSTRGSWASLAEEIGLDGKNGLSLKLVYFKYLGGLNPFPRKVLGEELSGSKESLSSSVESETEAKNLNRQVFDQEDCMSRASLGLGGDRFLTPVRRNAGPSDREDESDKLVVLDPAMANAVFSSLKRKREMKRESMMQMLNWVLRVAKNPTHSSVGWVKANDKERGVGELMSHALTARKMMFLKKASDINGNGSVLQKRQKVHSSMYEDDNGLDTNGNQKVRSSERIRLINRQSHLFSSSEATTTPDKIGEKDVMTVAVDGSHEKRTLRKSSLLRNGSDSLLSRDPLQKRIPVGSYFQVKVPKWTVITSCGSDDQKWLGTRLCPVESTGRKPLIERVLVGKGRERKCACHFPGSVECIRFHVAQKRLQLKQELGPAFIEGGFSDMGEEVSLSWTKEEERRFKAVVRLNPPSLNKNLWNALRFSFPSKGRQKLVNYYFNVFLLRCRSYQNRATPSSIDSDDEDIDHGFLSRPLSHEAIKVHDRMSCSGTKNDVDSSDCSGTS